MGRPRAALFDLDDTIVDFEANGQPAACWHPTLEAHAGALGGAEPVAAYAAIEATRAWFWSDTARFHRGSLDLRAAGTEIVFRAMGALGVTLDEAAARRLSDDYRDRRDAGLRLFDGALVALDQLRSQGLGLGLVTNG